jgi:hypothetical protein
MDLACDAAERTKRARESLAPIVLALTQRRANEDPTRVAEHCDEQVNLRARAIDDDPLLAKVDLHLVARRGLEPNRRDLGRALRLAMRREHALQCPKRNLDLLLGEQSLHDDAIAGGGPVEQRPRLITHRCVERPRARS